MAPIHVAVLGAGGVGGLLGGLLSRVGDRVTVLSEGTSAERLKAGGLHIRSPRFGEFSAPVAVTPELEDGCDVLIVAVKAPSLDAALGRVPAARLGQALVVPVLNGIEHVGLLRERYPEARVVAATIRVESARVAPGDIEHSSPFTSMEMARLPGAADDLERLRQHLEAAGVAVAVREGEAAVLWTKLAFLAPLALLTTSSGAPIGVARSSRREELVALVEEAAAVARSEGATLSPTEVIEAFERLPATMTSSMQRDAAAGRPTEIEAIGGSLLRAAERHGLEIPVTARLVGELRKAG